jgi:hypothetical protein
MKESRFNICYCHQSLNSRSFYNPGACSSTETMAFFVEELLRLTLLSLAFGLTSEFPVLLWFTDGRTG